MYDVKTMADGPASPELVTAIKPTETSRAKESEIKTRKDLDYSQCWKEEDPRFCSLRGGITLAQVGLPSGERLSETMRLPNKDEPWRIAEILATYDQSLAYAKDKPAEWHKQVADLRYFLVTDIFKAGNILGQLDKVRDPALAGLSEYIAGLHPEDQEYLKGKSEEEVMGYAISDFKAPFIQKAESYETYKSRVAALRTGFSSSGETVLESDDLFIAECYRKILSMDPSDDIVKEAQGVAKHHMGRLAQDKLIPRGVVAHDKWDYERFKSWEGDKQVRTGSLPPNIFFSIDDSGSDYHISAQMALWRSVRSAVDTTDLQNKRKKSENRWITETRPGDELEIPNPPNLVDGVYVTLPYVNKQGQTDNVNLVFMTDISRVNPVLTKRVSQAIRGATGNEFEAVLFSPNAKGELVPAVPAFSDTVSADYQLAIKEKNVPLTYTTLGEVRLEKSGMS